MVEYKHALIKSDTHKRLRLYIAHKELKSFDDGINQLIDKAEKNDKSDGQAVSEIL